MKIDWIFVYTQELERLSELYKLKESGREMSDDEIEEYESLVDQIGQWLPVVSS